MLQELQVIIIWGRSWGRWIRNFGRIEKIRRQKQIYSRYFRWPETELPNDSRCRNNQGNRSWSRANRVINFFKTCLTLWKDPVLLLIYFYYRKFSKQVQNVKSKLSGKSKEETPKPQHDLEGDNYFALQREEEKNHKL